MGVFDTVQKIEIGTLFRAVLSMMEFAFGKNNHIPHARLIAQCSPDRSVSIVSLARRLHVRVCAAILPSCPCRNERWCSHFTIMSMPER